MSTRRLALALVAVACTVTPALAAHHRPILLHVPRFEVLPGHDREVCSFVRAPMQEPFDIGGYVVHGLATKANAGSTSHHFLLYAYNGTDIDGFAPIEGTVVDSKNCLDLGPADATSRLLLVGVQTPRAAVRYPTGLAMRLAPIDTAQGKAVGFILNSHWINGTPATMPGGVKVKLLPARPKHVKKYLKPIFEVVANAFIDVGPGETKTAGWRWGPGLPNLAANLGGVATPEGPACVVSLTGHMHKWGALFTADYAAGGQPDRVYENQDYDHPGQSTFAPAMLVRNGEHIDYTCTHDNGVAKPEKLGCEETPGVAPGMSIIAAMGAGRGLAGAAAKPCTTAGTDAAECPVTDPAYPGRTFTGQCVPARLVFGFTSKDEMCILGGSYYDADANAAPGHECDLR